MNDVLDGIAELKNIIIEIRKDVWKAINKINDTPDDRSVDELNECINTVDSILHDVYEKLG